jgi:hypothetical protein
MGLDELKAHQAQEAADYEEHRAEVLAVALCGCYPLQTQKCGITIS